MKVDAVSHPAVSVVVPVYRNRDTLEELCRRAASVLETAAPEHELLFVVDGCRDGSAELLEQMARNDSRIAALVLARNVGQHRAVLLGLRFARGSLVVVMDADLQDPPEALPLLLGEMAKGGAEAVFAGRRGRYESAFRLLTSRMFKTALHAVSGVPRDAGMFFVMTRAMSERLARADCDRPFVVAMIGRTGLPVRSVPVTRSSRRCPGTAYSFGARLRVGVGAFLWAARHPVLPDNEKTGAPAADDLVDSYIGARFTAGGHSS